MSEEQIITTDPSRAAVVQFKAIRDEMSDEDAKAHAASMLRERLRVNGYAMSTDPVPGKPQPVTLNPEHTGWRPFEPGTGTLDGHVIEWTATGVPIVTDPEPLTDGDTSTPGMYTVPVPPEVTAAGGPVRVRHGLSGPVTVTVVADGDAPMGYLFTQPVTDDEEHIELVAGATRIVVTRDVLPDEATS